MSQLQSGFATVPRGFRYHENDEEHFRTPEPLNVDEDLQIPSPPRARLRLKRRHVSQPLTAPTQQFLASVAAADVPLPSVEEPVGDAEMMESVPQLQFQEVDNQTDIYQHIAPRQSPPKTPALELAPAMPSSKYPDWSIGSVYSNSDVECSSDYESSRPSTAFSTHTSGSVFSRYSIASEDDECLSPGAELPSEFPGFEAKPQEQLLAAEKPRKAPWTKAMSAHLWSTYLLYLNDPRVTPIRLGKSCIPPSGVCLRVARQAKRSWKGSNKHLTAEDRSRDVTPTAGTSRPYVQWPHTCAATRAQLRALCKVKGTSNLDQSRRCSKSPTPYNKRAAQRRLNRKSTPARSASIFSSRDMAMSLTMSTSDAMQPQGPLAQLASSPLQSDEETEQELEPFPLLPYTEHNIPLAAETSADLSVPESFHVGLSGLASPFAAKSYGPSSSTSLAASINLPRQSNTVGARKLLKSPVRLTRSRSGTQKRRSAKATLEDKPRKRPSLVAAFGRELAERLERADHGRREPPMPSTIINDEDVFGPRKRRAETLIPTTHVPPVPSVSMAAPFVIDGTSSLNPPEQQTRLGSPFAGLGSSHSFPHRLSSPVPFNLTSFRRPFATVQQCSRPPSESEPSSRSSLASRLAYLDQRLKDFRHRGQIRTRSQSPI